MAANSRPPRASFRRVAIRSEKNGTQLIGHSLVQGDDDLAETARLPPNFNQRSPIGERGQALSIAVSACRRRRPPSTRRPIRVRPNKAGALVVTRIGCPSSGRVAADLRSVTVEDDFVA